MPKHTAHVTRKNERSGTFHDVDFSVTQDEAGNTLEFKLAIKDLNGFAANDQISEITISDEHCQIHTISFDDFD